MIIVILLFATLFRFINLNQSLWLDEAINVIGVKDHSLISLITNYSIGDFHPPGYFILLWLWSRIFGVSEISVRLPSVIFGVLTVYIAFLIGKKIFNRKIAILASLFLAIAPLHVYYSQEARMYSFASFAVTLSMYYFISDFTKTPLSGDEVNEERTFRRKPRVINPRLFIKLISDEKISKVSFILSSFLVLYSDYVAYLIIPVQLLFLFFVKRNKFFMFIKTFSISFLLLIPWLPFFINQLKTGFETSILLTNWSNVVGGASLKNLLLVFVKILFGRISIANKIIYSFISLVGFSLYALIFSKATKKLDDQTRLLICWIIVPIIFAFTISFFIPVLAYFRMLFILPAAYLLLAKGLDVLKGFWFWGSLGAIILISLISLFIFNTNLKFQREDWKEAINYVQQKQDSKSLILLENNDIFAPIKYYSFNLSTFSPGLKKVPATKEVDILDLGNLLKNKERIYLFEYLVDITDPNRILEKRLTLSGFAKKETLNFNGVGFVHVFTRI